MDASLNKRISINILVALAKRC